MTKSQNRGDRCSSVSFTCENGGPAPWSDIDHNLLYLVMMKVEAVDFNAFSEVCKSWRSLALSNKTNFMESRSPMAISISNKKVYSLEDSEGRKSKIMLPHSAGRTCVGLTSGYLVLFGKETRDFWLVNPITRHGLHFPAIPTYVQQEGVRAILVFSPSISAWVFLVLFRYSNLICFSTPGKGVWHCVFSGFAMRDLHDFKGKIYVINTDFVLYELKLDPKPKLAKPKTKSHAGSFHRYMHPRFLELVCSGENLYAIKCFSEKEYEVHEVDVGEMKWVSPKEGTMEEHAFFVSNLKHSAVIKRELLPDPWSRYKKYAYGDTSGNRMFFTTDLWYFAHDSLKLNLKHG